MCKRTATQTCRVSKVIILNPRMFTFSPTMPNEYTYVNSTTIVHYGQQTLYAHSIELLICSGRHCPSIFLLWCALDTINENQMHCAHYVNFFNLSIALQSACLKNIDQTAWNKVLKSSWISYKFYSISW